MIRIIWAKVGRRCRRGGRRGRRGCHDAFWPLWAPQTRPTLRARTVKSSLGGRRRASGRLFVCHCWKSFIVVGKQTNRQTDNG